MAEELATGYRTPGTALPPFFRNVLQTSLKECMTQLVATANTNYLITYKTIMKELEITGLREIKGGHCPPNDQKGISYAVGYFIGTVLMWFDGDVNIN